MAYLATLRVGFWTATRTGYTREIGISIGSGGRCRSGSLKQREGVNNPCAPVALPLSCYIRPGNKVKSELNPEVGVEPVGISLPYDHLLLPEESRNLGCMVAPELYALQLIALFQPFLVLAVAADAALRKNGIQCRAVHILGNVACRVERSLGRTPRAPLPWLVGFHQLGQRLAVDAEGEGFELTRGYGLPPPR